MKRLFLLLVFVNIFTGLLAQTEFFYSASGKKEVFRTRKDRILLKTKSSADTKRISGQSRFRQTNRFGDDKLIATIDTLTVDVEQLKQSPDIADASCWLEYADGTLQIPTDQIFIKPLDGISVEQVMKKTGETFHIFKIWNV